MQEFIKKEKVKSTLDHKEAPIAKGKKHISHQLASSTSDVQKGDYSNDDIS